MNQFRQSEFLLEAKEQLNLLFADLAALRLRRQIGRERRELLARIFRHVHTLKGAASTVKAKSIARTAHEFETLLDGLRLGQIELNDAVLNALEMATKKIAADLSAFAHHRPPKSSRQIINHLQKTAAENQTKSDLTDAALASLPANTANIINAYERQRLREAMLEGAKILLITATFDVADFDTSFRQLSETLAAAGEIVSTLPGGTAKNPEQINFRLLFAAQKSLEQIQSDVARSNAQAIEILNDPLSAATSEDLRAPASEEVKPKRDEASRLTASREADSGETNASPNFTETDSASSVRVSVAEINDLIRATRDLSAAAINCFEFVISPQVAAHLPLEMRAAIENDFSGLRRRFSELETRLAELRTVPIKQVFERAAHVGRVTARDTDKQVNFEILGGEIRIARSLAERLAAPLSHLVRNAVVHAIEPKEERKALNKPERGKVGLEASDEGAFLLIRVCDDGCGIDMENALQTAQNRGIVSPDAVSSEQETLRLIFQLGFSTAKEINEVSGRGVGLHIVEHEIRELGGAINISTEKNLGTTFELQIPKSKDEG